MIDFPSHFGPRYFYPFPDVSAVKLPALEHYTGFCKALLKETLVFVLHTDLHSQHIE